MIDTVVLEREGNGYSIYWVSREGYKFEERIYK